MYYCISIVSTIALYGHASLEHLCFHTKTHNTFSVQQLIFEPLLVSERLCKRFLCIYISKIIISETKKCKKGNNRPSSNNLKSLRPLKIKNILTNDFNSIADKGEKQCSLRVYKWI